MMTYTETKIYPRYSEAVAHLRRQGFEPDRDIGHLWHIDLVDAQIVNAWDGYVWRGWRIAYRA
jgi:hypothetical protein